MQLIKQGDINIIIFLITLFLWNTICCIINAPIKNKEGSDKIGKMAIAPPSKNNFLVVYSVKFSFAKKMKHKSKTKTSEEYCLNSWQ
ncbi:hypothetical protein IKP85_01205 [bacterium]|nr:hypothetical protein [bacterium]